MGYRGPEGLRASSEPLPPVGDRRREIGVAIVLVIVVLGVIATVTFVPPHTTSPAVPVLPIAFQVPATSGNASAGWTYKLNVLALASYERPHPIVWGDLDVGLAWSGNDTWVSPYPAPAGSALWAESSTGGVVARGNLTLGLWQDGYFVLVETGQVLVLHAPVAPGKSYVSGEGAGTYVGPVLVVEYENAGNSVTFNLQL